MKQRFLQPLTLLVIGISLLPPIWTALYLWTYRVNLPLSDTLFRSMPVVVAVKNNTLSYDDLIRSYIGHITIPSFLVSAFVAWVSDWNIYWEVLIVWGLTLTCFSFIISLIRLTDQDSTLLTLIPISVLVFSMKPTFNLHVTYGGIAWMTLNALLVFWMVWVARLKSQKWMWGLSALMIPLATFTHGQGFIIAGFIAIAPLIYKRKHILLSLGLMLYAILFTLLYLRITGSSGEGLLSNFDPFTAVGFLLPYLGAMFAQSSYVAGTVAAVGLLLLVVNGVWLLRQGYSIVWLWWLIAAYPVLTGGLISLARSAVIIEPWKQTQYISITFMFWVVVVVLMGVVIRHNWENGNRFLLWLNILSAFAGITLYGTTDFTSKPVIDFRYANETCHWTLLFWQDAERVLAEPDCAHLIERPLEINVLAYYELAMFAKADAINILPPDSAPSETILIVTQTAWEAYHVQNWLLDGVDAVQVDTFYTEPLLTFPEYDITAESLPVSVSLDKLTSGYDWVIYRDEATLPETLAESISTWTPTVYTVPGHVTYAIVRATP